MKQLQIPPLSEGETYIGAIGDKNGDVYHVVLLPGDNDDATWEAQIEWAKSIGGDLPTRVEQSMLWAGHRDQFKKDLYWSNETHYKSDKHAWFQRFGLGYHGNIRKDLVLRAGAVRRVPA